MKRKTMVKARAMALVLGVVLASVTVAGSLQGGGQRGGQGGGGPMGGQRGGMRQGPQSLAQLATRPDVAREIGLTEAQGESIRALMESSRPARPGQGGGVQPPQGGDREAMRAQMEARVAAMDQKLAAILSQTQFKRVGEISIQLRGLTAAFDPKVQTQLGLSDAQKQSLQALAQPRGGPRGGGPGGPGGPPPMGEGGEGGPPPPPEDGQRGPGGPGRGQDPRRAELEAKIAEILTDAQEAKLKSLGGKAFVADERGPGGPGGRRGPGGPEGPGEPGGPGGPAELALMEGVLG